MIEILLSTYNGAKYLDQWLFGLECQTMSDWFLSVRDDGSNDETMSILQKFAMKHEGRVHVESGKNVGCLASYEWLMRNARKGEYFVFADQDDIWLPQKIEHAFQLMQENEQEKSDIPIVICTDLIVVDENLHKIADSMWDYARTNAELLATSDFLNIFNCATGCTMLFNRLALDCALPINMKVAVMHDYWVALSVKNAGGRIVTSRRADILYRQHEMNEIGAYKYVPFYRRGWRYLLESWSFNKRNFVQAHALSGISCMKYVYLKIKYYFVKY